MALFEYDETEMVRRENFYKECIKSYEEFEIGAIYETLHGSRIICMETGAKRIGFKNLGVFNSDGTIIRTDCTVFWADPQTHPFSWYASRKIGQQEMEQIKSAVYDGVLPGEQAQPKIGSESVGGIIQGLMDAGMVDFDEVALGVRARRPEVSESTIRTQFARIRKLMGTPGKAKNEKVIQLFTEESIADEGSIAAAPSEEINPDVDVEPSAASPENKICPTCGSTNTQDAVLCVSCFGALTNEPF